MSYTKLNLEIEKHYRLIGLSIYYDPSTTSDEEREKKHKRHKQIRDIIVERWKDEKKYKELISCAHKRWYPYEEFTEPLAQHFIKNNELLYLKVLCEKEIRSRIERTLSYARDVKKAFPEITKEEIISYNLEKYIKSQTHHPVGEVSYWRDISLSLLNRYIELLKQTKDSDYLKIIEDLNEKTQKLTIKKSDLKNIKHKLK